MLLLAVIIDLLIFGLCTMVMFRHLPMRFTNPAFIYLAYHGLTVTLRGIFVLLGAPTVFSDPVFINAGYLPPTLDEIARAVVFADIALVAFTIGAFIAMRRYNRFSTTAQEHIQSVVRRRPTELATRRLVPVAVITCLIGLVGIAIFSALPGFGEGGRVNFGAWNDSSWVRQIELWFGLGVLMLIYRYGPKPFLTVLLGLFAFIMIYQGYHRFRAVLLMLFYLFIYLEWRGLKWPTRPMVIAMIVGFIAFLPMKEVGQMLQDGRSFDAIAQRVGDVTVQNISSGFGDLAFLDQLAMAITLIDDHGRLYGFETYLPLITLPIPRPLWPDKPEIAFYVDDIQTRARPIGTIGMVVTLVGESYVSFGLPGIFLIIMLTSYLFSRFFFKAYDAGYFSVAHFLFIVVMSVVVQVYRDGLTSIVIFAVVNYLPLMALGVLHLIFPPRAEFARNPTEFLPDVLTRPSLQRAPVTGRVPNAMR